MPLISNLASAAYPDQAGVDSAHFELLREAINRNGVLVGCEVTARSPVSALVDVAAGAISLNLANVAVAAQALTFANGHATMPRFDIVVIDDAGVASVVAGAVATQTNPDGTSNAAFPAIPADRVLIAAVYVPAGVNTIGPDQIMFLGARIGPDNILDVTDAPFSAVGDGITDDSSAFQDAIDKVYETGGGVVNVPPGRYVIGNPVEIKSNVTLRGVNSDNVGLAMSTGAGTLDKDEMRHSVLLIRDRQGTDSYTEGTFQLQGSAPTISGLVFYYDQQKRPLQRWMPLRKYDLGDRIEPLTVYTNVTYPWVGTGFIYEATIVAPAGTVVATASTPPTFPTTVGTTVTESTGFQWTCRGTLAQAAEHYGEPWLTTHGTPYTYPATVTLHPTVSAKLPSIRNCFFANSYAAIAFEANHNLVQISDCWIGSYRRGIYINHSGGIARISNIHCFPYYANVNNIQYLEGAGDSDGTTGTENQTTNWHGEWVESHGAGAELRDALWVMLDRFFVYAQEIGLLLSPASDGKSSNGSGTHCKFDHCSIGIDVTKTNAAGWVFYGTHIHANSVRAIGSRHSVRTAALASASDPIDVAFIGGFFNVGGGIADVKHQGGNMILDNILFGGVPNTGGDSIRVYAEGSGPPMCLVVSKCRFLTGNNAVPVVNFNASVVGKAMIVDNDFGTRTPATAITGPKPAGTIVRDNIGYVTRNKGASLSHVPAATIAHGLATTPSVVFLTAGTVGQIVSVSGIGATTFTVHLRFHDGTTPVNGNVYWAAEV